MGVTTNILDRRAAWTRAPAFLARPLTLGLAAALILLAVVVAAQGSALFRDRMVAERAEAVMSAARAVQAVEAEAEAAERGYVLTGDVSFVIGIQNALDTLPGSAARLRRLAAHDPAQAARAATLESVVARRTEHLMHAVEMRRNVGARAAREYVLRSEVREVDRRLRVLLTQIIEAELATRDAR